MKKQRRFYYRLPKTSSFYANGPFPAKNLKDARRRLRELLGVERLPYRTEVWEA